MATMTELSAPAHELRLALEIAWQQIIKRHPELPPVRIILDDNRPSEPTAWDRDNATLTVARDQRGSETALTTLLRAATYILADVRGVQVTSNLNRYHNAEFKELAKELGLIADRDPDRFEVYGWSVVTLAPSTRKAYAGQLRDIGTALIHMPPITDAKSRRTSAQARVTMECQCEEPKRISAYPRSAARGGFRCDDCGQLFEEIVK